ITLQGIVRCIGVLERPRHRKTGGKPACQLVGDQLLRAAVYGTLKHGTLAAGLLLFELRLEVIRLLNGKLPEVRASAQLAVLKRRAHPSHHLLDRTWSNQGPQFARVLAAANLARGDSRLEKALAGEDDDGFI